MTGLGGTVSSCFSVIVVAGRGWDSTKKRATGIRNKSELNRGEDGAVERRKKERMWLKKRAAEGKGAKVEKTNGKKGAKLRRETGNERSTDVGRP